MPKFGLDYPRLRALNPGIILCSMPGYGSQGPHRSFISYGTNVDPASGLASLMGYPGEEPHMNGNAYPDPVAALFAVGAILTALYHQRRTGQGQYIDLSQAEATTALLGEASLGTRLNGAVPPRLGNRHPRQAPHGCYPCRGDDAWVAIAVDSDDEWRALTRAPGPAGLVCRGPLCHAVRAPATSRCAGPPHCRVDVATGRLRRDAQPASRRCAGRRGRQRRATGQRPAPAHPRFLLGH